MTPERDIPPLAGESFQAWFAGRGARGPAGGPRLLVWPDTFTNYLEPAIGRDAVAALEALGYRVEVPSAPVCCGLTWHSTGQLGQAKKVLAATLAVLKPWLDDEVPIVGLEPSCLAALKTDAVELLPDDPAAKQASVSVRSLAEVLRPHLAELRARAAASPAAGAPTAAPPPTATAAPATPATPSTPAAPEATAAPATSTTPSPLTTAASKASAAPGTPATSPVRALVQVHCHQHADLGFEADREVLAALGVEAEVLDSGCCGLAGNFGFEQGHYEVSQACAERVLYPALRADQEAQVVADGYSCRTQIRQGVDRDPVHLAHLAATVLTSADSQATPAP